MHRWIQNNKFISALSNPKFILLESLNYIKEMISIYRRTIKPPRLVLKRNLLYQIKFRIFQVVPCLSPISSLIFVRPYRQAIEDFLSTLSAAVYLSYRRSSTSGKNWKSFSIDLQQRKSEVDDEPDFTNTSCV